MMLSIELLSTSGALFNKNFSLLKEYGSTWNGKKSISF
jgi:hypothetical protein